MKCYEEKRGHESATVRRVPPLESVRSCTTSLAADCRFEYEESHDLSGGSAPVPPVPSATVSGIKALLLDKSYRIISMSQEPPSNIINKYSS